MGEIRAASAPFCSSSEVSFSLFPASTDKSACTFRRVFTILECWKPLLEPCSQAMNHSCSTIALTAHIHHTRTCGYFDPSMAVTACPPAMLQSHPRASSYFDRVAVRADRVCVTSFNPIHGLPAISTNATSATCWNWPRFNPIHGLSAISTNYHYWECRQTEAGFNPIHGLPAISTAFGP